MDSDKDLYVTTDPDVALRGSAVWDFSMDGLR